MSINQNEGVKLLLPNYIKKSIEEGCVHFGDTFGEMIETAINIKTQSLSNDNIIALNNIYKNMDIKHSAIEESLQVMSSPNNSIKFWDSILESANLTDNQKKNIHSIKVILEADETTETTDTKTTKPPKKESIEGDGEDPEVDDTEVTPVVGEEAEAQDPNATESSEPPEGQDPEAAPEMQMAPEQVLQMELTQTNNKFMVLTLYEKINELLDTIDTILETVSSSKTEENLEMFENLKMYQNYLYILSELIFVMDLNTVYYNFTSIALEVNDLLDKYLISTKVKVLNDKDISTDEKKSILLDLRQNLASKIEANDEIQDEGND